MLNPLTQITPTSTLDKNLESPDLPNRIRSLLSVHGYCLLRNFSTNPDVFARLVRKMCHQVTFDPARGIYANTIQQVNAGSGAIGLHIENGNTPNTPEIIGFYCHQAPTQSSPTTLCDGIRLLNALPAQLKSKLSTSMTVTRTLPEAVWQRYLLQEHPEYKTAGAISPAQLQHVLGTLPGQSGTLHDDGSLLYSVDVDLILTSKLAERRAFANALLGPSLHHEKPVYRLHNNTVLNEALLKELSDIAENHTQDIDWQQGDIIFLDNWRFMHGRRAIKDNQTRQLYIGMGSVS